MTVAFVSAAEALANGSLREEWRRLAAAATTLNVMYASPEWVEHLVTCDPNGRYFVGVATDQQQRITGIAPVQIDTFALKFDIASRVLVRSALSAVSLLGSEPLAEAESGAYGKLFGGMFDRFAECDCAYLDSVPVDGPCWDWLQSAGAAGGAQPYLPDGVRPWHHLALKATFDEYLSSMSPKTRYTLRKHVKALREFGGGALTLEPVRTPAGVSSFVNAAISVSRESWQHRVLGARLADAATEERRLGDLAARGILRAYLLRCGSQPCAFLVGYQFNGVFHYAETAFAEPFAHLSPGTVMLYLVIEELHRSDAPSVVNFGVGDGVHKRRFGNTQGHDATVVLFRRSLANGIRRNSHRLFNAGVRIGKQILRRRVSK